MHWRWCDWYWCDLCVYNWVWSSLISSRRQCCPRELFASPHECSAYFQKCCVGNYKLEQCSQILGWSVFSKTLTEYTPYQIAKIFSSTLIGYRSCTKMSIRLCLVSGMASCEVKLFSDICEFIIHSLSLKPRFGAPLMIPIYLSDFFGVLKVINVIFNHVMMLLVYIKYWIYE